MVFGPSTEALPVSSRNYVSHSTDRSKRTRELIVVALADPTSRRATQEEIARRIGVSSRTLRAHIRSDPTIRQEARELYRARYVPGEMLDVDRAMFKTAKTPGRDGVADRKLAYRVMDGIEDREDIGSTQELVVAIKCVDDFAGITQEVGVRIRPRRQD